MERDSLHLHLHGMDEPISLYKSQYLINKNPNYYSFSPSKGLLKAPPLSLLHSSAPSFSPALLPLPASLPRRSSSCPTKIGTKKHQRKSTKTSTSNNNYTIPKRDEKKTHSKRSSDTVTATPAGKFGPETAALPRNTARVARFDDSVIRNRVDMLLGSVVFAVSPPPPSSLPLPTFSLRPKLSCNAAAAGIDAGATDDLRRLLRLQ